MSLGGQEVLSEVAEGSDKDKLQLFVTFPPESGLTRAAQSGVIEKSCHLHQLLILSGARICSDLCEPREPDPS